MTKARADTVRLQRTAKAFCESAALMSGVELGRFTAVSRGENTIERAGFVGVRADEFVPETLTQVSGRKPQ